MNDMSDEDKKITGELPAAKPVKAEKQNPPILTKEDKAECYVYIGANRLTDGLKCNTVYRGYPKELVEQGKVREYCTALCPYRAAGKGTGRGQAQGHTAVLGMG